MIVSSVITSLTEKVKDIIEALANRLTARDNWGPEGERFQVLTSNGPSEDDPPPSFKNLADILTGISVTNPDLLPGLPGAAGPPGPPGADGANGMMPTYIGAGETFTVPVNRQALWKESVIVDTGGLLNVLGALVEVD
jgi:hypothetical protein